jgi:hypothetical protein
MTIELFRKVLRGLGFHTEAVHSSPALKVLRQPVPVWYCPEMLAYQAEVLNSDPQQSQAGEPVIYSPLCLLLLVRGQVVGLFSAVVGAQSNRLVFRSHCSDLLCPILEVDDRSLRRRLIDALVSAIRQCDVTMSLSVICVPSLDLATPLEFYWAEKAARCEVFFEGLVDTALDDERYFALARSSLGAQIKKAEPLWQVELVDQKATNIEASFALMRQLHAEVAGRVTRSELTWKRQAAHTSTGQGLLVMLRQATMPSSQAADAQPIAEDTDGIVGAAYFDIGCGEMMYSSAAYRRELFDQPIGHLAQWAAINYARQQGIRQYRVGSLPVAATHPNASAKELQIAGFKGSVATHLLPAHRYQINN